MVTDNRVYPGSVFLVEGRWRFSYFFNGERIATNQEFSHAGAAKREMHRVVGELKGAKDLCQICRKPTRGPYHPNAKVYHIKCLKDSGGFPEMKK